MRNFQHRLRRLERRVRLVGAEVMRHMPNAELFALVGLPPDPTRQQLDALIAELKEDLTRTAPGYRIPK